MKRKIYLKNNDFLNLSNIPFLKFSLDKEKEASRFKINDLIEIINETNNEVILKQIIDVSNNEKEITIHFSNVKDEHLREEKINSNLVYRGVFLNFYKDEVKLSNNHHTKREYVKHPGACAILVIKDGYVYLEKQFRYPIDEVIYEIPAGKIDDLETPLECAKRELQEETGFVCTNLEYLGSTYALPAYSDEIVYIFYTDDFEKQNNCFDDDEILEIEKIPYEKVLEMIKQGKIIDSKTLIALYLYDLKVKTRKE